MKKLRFRRAAIGAVALSASVLGAGAQAIAHQAMPANVKAATYMFTSISDPKDTTFTQLLGINRSGVIAGYYGSGTDAKHPNKGFSLNQPTSFTPENYPNSVQTQVVGINDGGSTDGFYIDTKGVTHGFTDMRGTFTSVDVPGTSFNQLLSINNKGEQTGYYAFGPSSTQTFVPFVRRTDGSFLLLPIANAQATTINNQDLVGGFYNDTAGNSHGFLWRSGSMPTTLNFQGAVSTQILGLNKGQAVGSYTDSKKVTHGFMYDLRTKAFTPIDAPQSSSTVVNGINKSGMLVGFYTDAKNNTIGFIAKPK